MTVNKLLMENYIQNQDFQPDGKTTLFNQFSVPIIALLLKDEYNYHHATRKLIAFGNKVKRFCIIKEWLSRRTFDNSKA